MVFLTGCNSGGTEANLAAIDIPLPYQEGYVQDMKITEDGNLTLAMYETMNGGKKQKLQCGRQAMTVKIGSSYTKSTLNRTILTKKL